jgi:NADH-quinone oxidoreductase subunit I
MDGMVVVMYGKGLLKGLGITLKHTFEREITQQYPEQMPVLPERFRGSLQFDFKKCIVCGMCEKVCPNHVLSLDTVKDETSKKKKLMNYTIDFQYCMYCNFCVENCPTHCLSFNHDFELAKYKREDIKRVYHRPEGMDVILPAEGSSGEEDNRAAEKQKKQIDAMIGALQKNPQKQLIKLLENEEQAEILAQILLDDENKMSRMAALLIEDKEKARKVAVAFVNKALKDRQKEGGVTNESE